MTPNYSNIRQAQETDFIPARAGWRKLQDTYIFLLGVLCAVISKMSEPEQAFDQCVSILLQNRLFAGRGYFRKFRVSF